MHHGFVDLQVIDLLDRLNGDFIMHIEAKPEEVKHQKVLKNRSR